MDERRKEPRYLVKEDAVVWDLHHMRAGCHPAKIVDISRSGMRLESTGKLTRGHQIAVDYRGMIICGTVQHSGRMKDHFATGVLIRDVLDPLGEDTVGRSANQETPVEAGAVVG
ncbi:MAG TPA: PilZ domain-containing protein [Bryobacteraceae bacterium]|nr:PilZ domain-containing protein [Bryobacteraceae bacterium]